MVIHTSIFDIVTDHTSQFSLEESAHDSNSVEARRGQAVITSCAARNRRRSEKLESDMLEKERTRAHVIAGLNGA